MYLNVILRSLEVDMSEWISVEDELPDEQEQVLGFSNTGAVEIYETLWREDFGIWQITHWQPLPKPPAE